MKEESERHLVTAPELNWHEAGEKARYRPNGTVQVLVEGAQRAKVLKYTDCSEYYEAEAAALGDTMGERVEVEAFARSVTTEFENYVKLNKEVSPEVVGVVQRIEDYAKLA